MHKSIIYVQLMFATFELLPGVLLVPLSPCPQIFHYEYDGQQWHGIAKVYSRVYNDIQTNKITMIIVLLMNGQIVDSRKFGSLNLYYTITETYRNMALRQPIVYRVNFPLQSMTPSVLEISLNNVIICINGHSAINMYETIHAKIQLQHTFHIPVLDFDRKIVVPLNPAHSHTNDDNHTVSNSNPSLLDQPFQAPTQFGCGEVDNRFKLTQLVSGGEEISRGTWPWLVAIFLKAPGGIAFKCTGTLLSKRIVATAAHCFMLYNKELSSSEVLLSFGRHNLRDWTENDIVLSDVEYIAIHDDYLTGTSPHNFDSDIALLVTKKSIKFTALIKPICLWPAAASSDTSDIVGLTGTLVGWGKPNERNIVNVPRKLKMMIVETSSCLSKSDSRLKLRFFDSVRNRSNRMFCTTSTAFYGPCNGDSGSGLAIWQNGVWFLRGIVSAAIGDPILSRCDLNRFIIFTDITQYGAWINAFL